MKIYVHAHRADRPGKCYWVCEVGSRVNGLHPDFGMADVFDEIELPTIATSMCAQFGVAMEFIGVPVSQPDMLPASIRELIRLD